MGNLPCVSENKSLQFASVRYRFPIAAMWFVLAQSIFSFATAVPDTLMNFYLSELGFDTVYIGMWHAASQIGAAITLFPCLWLFERIGRRAALIGGVLASNLARLSMFVTTTPTLVIAAEAASGFGTVLFSLASISLLADLSQAENRAELFSFHDGIRGLLALFGGLCAAILPAWLTSMIVQPYHTILVGAFIIRLIGVLPLLSIRDLPTLRPSQVFNPLALIRTRWQVLWLCVPYMLMQVAYLLLAPFFNLMLRLRYGASDFEVGVLLTLRGVMSGLTALGLTGIATQLGVRRGVFIGLMGTALCFTGLAFGQNLQLAMLILVLQVIFYSIANPLFRADYIGNIRRDEYFVASSLMGFASGFVGPIISPPLSGIIQRDYGFEPLFWLAGGLMALSALVFTMQQTYPYSSPK